MVADILSEWCEVNHILHNGQMGFRRQSSAIDTVAHVVRRVQRAWVEGKLAGILLIDVRGAFDHVSQGWLL